MKLLRYNGANPGRAEWQFVWLEGHFVSTFSVRTVGYADADRWRPSVAAYF